MPPAGGVFGLQGCLKALQKMKKQDTINIRIGIEKCLETIGKKADHYVPKDTLLLMKSRRNMVTGNGLATTGTIDYLASYAMPVHELPVYHAPPTCHKWLMRAMRESKGTCTNIMKRQIKVFKT